MSNGCSLIHTESSLHIASTTAPFCFGVWQIIRLIPQVRKLFWASSFCIKIRCVTPCLGVWQPPLRLWAGVDVHTPSLQTGSNPLDAITAQCMNLKCQNGPSCDAACALSTASASSSTSAIIPQHRCLFKWLWSAWAAKRGGIKHRGPGNYRR